MTQDELQMEEDVRRFLLGEMSEDERARFEEMFVTDEDLFEKVRVGEDELIESYLRGTLRSGEKEIFERSFLTTARRRSRVEFTRAMLDKLTRQSEVAVVKKTATVPKEASPSAWNSIANFFKTPAVAFGMAFALVVLILGGWFLQRNTYRTELARQITPTPVAPTIRPSANENLPAGETSPVTSNSDAGVKLPPNKNGSPENTNRETNKNQNSGARKQTTNERAPVLALFAGGVRGEGKTSALNLPQDAPGAILQLHLERQDYKIYRVEIADPDGNRIFRNNNLRAKNSKITLFVPAKKLARGDYLIRLSALNPQNEGESVADYTLRVNRK